MSTDTTARPWVPEDPTVPRLAEAAQECRGCELWEDATQVVFSTGGERARLALVGEQPGDREDQAGQPFVGPAGGVLDRALEEAGIDRGAVYLTNAVKHFRHEQRGKRRIHQKPDLRHLVACGPWLEAELSVVDPDVVVCLGATAARAVLGRAVKIGAERGTVHDDVAGRATLVTTHPSALLRLRGRGGYDEAFAAFVADLRTAARAADEAKEH
ncbi:UdgX family uracil-DNA binding protein [uncultured Nocardioides sp.]|uniref:Type-4 uracil-DNA glycosylase n=1 Tax=uncultured Nocardioides sp. TaxID=198441 RepID=A0A6J4N7C1_9ACTN|nr:UdgX family uracil-DNA binding protein [uncultured Nocardioides sp.]CAA9376932.1 MAG: Uracil-DNA glycosylase, putative family 6 [uncultured Nocardioides sp.]